MHAEQYLTQITAERPPEWRRFPGWRGRVRPAPVRPTKRVELVWVTCAPWMVHYVRLPAHLSSRSRGVDT